MVEKQLSEKNTELLKNTKEKLDLENALKDNYFYLGSFLNKEDVEYPMHFYKNMLFLVLVFYQ